MGLTEDYWALVEEDENKKKKKKKKDNQVATPTSTGNLTDDYYALVAAEGDDIAPVSYGYQRDNKDDEERTWFRKGAFDDGYQFGDVTKTILGTTTDVAENLTTGVLGMGERIVDAGAYVAGGVGGLFGADKFQSDMAEFIKKDLYDEKAIAEALISGTEEHSVFGEKSDSLVQSGGQLLATIGLQAAGVPWFVTSGVTSFGGEAENALNEGASFGEAGLSAAISAGAEILTEKLFGGSGLGEKGLINLEPLTKGISSKIVKVLADHGVDMFAESAEEVVSQFASNLGSALYKEENLSDILFSEEAIDGYIESAIGGGVLGGIMNASNAVNSVRTGRDYRTGMTESDQKVVDRLVEQQIAEKETDGKKLSKKEKNEVYDDIIESLERGEISLDTIAEVIDGDSYKAYKDMVSTEEQAIKELSELYEGDELQKEIASFMEHAESQKVRSELDEKVFGLVKNGKLAESYYERGRRGQSYQADLSKYDEKQKATIQSAINSGVLNNTRRTHEFVDMIAKISADKGVLFDFTSNEKLKGSIYAVGEGKTVNGFVTESGVTLNVNSAKALNRVVGHEITHVLEGTELYNELQTVLFEYAKSRKATDSNFDSEYKERLYNTRQLYKSVDGYQGVDGFNKIKNEVAADLVGDYLFTDADFVKSLTKNKNLFQKLWDEVKYLHSVAKAGSKEEKQLLEVKRAFEKAYRESGKQTSEEIADSDVTYSVSVQDKDTLNMLNEQIARGAYDAETNPNGGYYVTYKSMSFWGYDDDGNAILRSPMAEYVDGKLSDAYVMPKDKGKLNWYQATETIDEKTGMPSGLLVSYRKPGNKSDSYVPASENQDLIAEDWSNLWFNLKKKILKDGKMKDSDVKARYNPYEHSSNYMLNDQFDSAYARDNLVTVKMYVPVSEDGGTFRAKWSKDPTGWTDWKSGKVASKIGAEKDFQRRVYLSRYAAPVEIVPDSEVAQAYKSYVEGTSVAVPDNVVSPSLLKELEKAGVPIKRSGKVKYSLSDSDYDRAYALDLFTKYAKEHPSMFKEEAYSVNDMTDDADFVRAVEEFDAKTASDTEIMAMGEKLLDFYDQNNEPFTWYGVDLNRADSLNEQRYKDANSIIPALQSVYKKIGDYVSSEYNDEHYARAWVQLDGQRILDEGATNFLHGEAIPEENRTKVMELVKNAIDLENRLQVAQEPKAKYSLSDSDGREISPAVQKRFAKSKVVDETGNLKVVYHGTATGEFSIFDKSKGNVEGDFGSGFYFTDNEADVSEHYEGGGPDFDNKVSRRAEEIWNEDDSLEYEEAERRAREELYKGSHKFEVYLNIENPAIVGETMLLDGESYREEYNEEDYEDYDDYLADVEQLVADDIENIVWEVERNCDVNDTDGIASILWDAYAEGGIGIEDLKKRLNDLYLEDSNGNLVENEVARQIIESLGFDGIIDPTVSGKWNMYIEKGTTHYIVFKPNQIKAVTNQNPTDNPDIHRSLSAKGEAPIRRSNFDVFGEDIALAPTEEVVSETETTTPAPVDIAPTGDDDAPISEEIVKDTAPVEEVAPAEETRAGTRKELHAGILDGIKSRFKAKGFDFDEVLKKAKNLSTFSTVDNTPQRVMEKALGYKEGQLLSDITVNQVAQNETEGIKWLNDRIDTIKQISKQYNIKPGSKESAAAQMYAEGFYVNETNDIIEYGDRELALDFPDANVRANIKALASDTRIRQMYDETLDMINESRARNLYPEIQRLDNYFLHFRAMDDTFSRIGLPFNPNDIRAKDLPTDLNGVTADLKPGQPYFASAMHRTGKRTSFDLIGGLERYMNSAKNQIYHIDDIQTLRALRNYIADTYGQANGLSDLDSLSEEEAQDRINQVFNSHLSTFAKFLNEEANVLAGKTALIDRGLEGIIGRRGITFLNELNKQVGSNMVGYNVSSSLTNFLPVVQTLAKGNKGAFVKAFAQTVAHKVSRQSDGFAENSPVMIRRKGADRFYRTPWQKVADPGYALMGMVDDISTELIARTKYNELVGKGMDSQTAHYETDKWVSRLMGDRSLGQMPQMYNSKMLGLITKFQLEVRNQLDSQFYDTIQEAKVSNEHIQNELARNAKTATKVASTFVQLAVVQHLFGTAFESVAGYNPAFDIIEVLMTAFGFDDDEDSEDTAMDNLEQGMLALLEDLPYTSTFLDGGRIPIASALPIEELVTGQDEWGNEKSRWETLKEVAPYYLMPGGYGQLKKTVKGLDMFSDDHPVAGSYTNSGNLRFPVEDTLANRIHAGIFGQYANENARDYFDNERTTLKEKQIQEFIDVEMPIKDYWEYRDGLKEQDTLEEKFDYIADLDLPVEKKNILINNIVDRKEAVDMTGYEDFSGYEEFDFAIKNPEKYEFLQKNNISYDAFKASDDSKDAYNWAYNNPEKYTLSKAICKDVVKYKKYTKDLYDIKADKDSNGDSIIGTAKRKKVDYINGLDLEYGEKLILFRSLYEADDTYNEEIIQYLNDRDDITYQERVTILKELGFEVSADGTTVYW